MSTCCSDTAQSSLWLGERVAVIRDFLFARYAVYGANMRLG
jgi:hypothetical protein